MNGRGKLAALMGTLVVLATFSLGVVPASSQATEAEYGGFLFAWEGQKYLSQNEHPSPDGKALDITHGNPGASFDVLAPKDGVVIYADDSSPDSWMGDCTSIEPATNYVVLGHGLQSDGNYAFYTMYYHLAYGSVPVEAGDFVRLGQRIGVAGRTGHATGIHLHFVGTDVRSRLTTSQVRSCSGQLLTSSRQWPTVSPSDTSSVGFEENGNQWPLLNGSTGTLNASFNWTGIQANAWDPRTANVILYNHIDFGGECVVIADPSQVFNVPSWMHVSSVYLNPSWAANHYLTIYNGPDRTGDRWGVLLSSVADLRTFNYWNDQIKSTHNTYTGASWLLEFSITDRLPLETVIHVRVQDQGDFDAMRVCFNGQNCQETAATELYYTWPVYLEQSGDYLISVQYRRESDNGNWANAERVEYGYHLEVDPRYAPCDGGDGATLTSGSDCIRVTANVSDLGFAGWGDRSDLVIEARGFDVLAYDSCCFQGPPRLIKNGETSSVGGNVSSIELRLPLSGSYVPEVPLGADSNTLAYIQMDEGSGSNVYSSVGTLTGSLTGGASFVTGRFGTAVYAPNPPSGSGVNFGTRDFGSPLTVELFVKFSSIGGDQRIATQLGGGPNTGYNKWIIGAVNGRFRVWLCYINGCHEAYSIESFSADRWYYLMLTYDGGRTGKFYVDSVLQATLSMDGTIAPGATTFELGQGEGIFGGNCVIDEVRVSNTVREPLGPPAPTPTPEPTVTPYPTATPTLTATATPTPQPSGTELLTQPWHLQGENGASEAYQQIDPYALQGMDALKVTLDLHGLEPLCGDASVLIFDQAGLDWDDGASLCYYAISGLDGEQTVEIPLSDFGDLNPEEAVGTMHTRFWYWSAFTVDITSIVAYSSGTPQPTATSTPTETPTPIPTPTGTPEPSGDTSRYNFEDGTTQGWGRADTVTGLVNTTGQAYAGSHSMCATLNLAGGSWQSGLAYVDDHAVEPGDTITARFYAPSGAQEVSSTIFLQDYYWGWYESAWAGLVTGQWTTLTWDLTGVGFATPSNRIGVHIGGNYAYQGCIYLDSVDVTTGGSAPTETPTPTPTSVVGGTELLTQAWHLVGSYGAAEAYQSIDPNALSGMDTVRVTYDLHGLNALGGDASALIFDQGGDWRYVSLSNYGQNGLNGSQTVDIPLSAFPGLNLGQPVGTLHTRFWFDGVFTVDITSVVVYDSTP